MGIKLEPAVSEFWLGLAQRMPEGLRNLYRFLRLLVSRFVEDQGLPHAASLTYTTLLSLVPLMTVSLAVFSAFPVSDRVADKVQLFLFENFVPTSGELLMGYFQTFSQEASKLSGAGFMFLIVVALMLMANIDRALNRIWRVTRKRAAISLFMEYWAILTLGPILIGVSVAATTYLSTIPLVSDTAAALGGGVGGLLKVAPLFASIVAFTLLYAVVPNRRVPVLHALAGGLLAALLFESAKRGFAYYVTSFPTYEAIYGAMAVVPIFLVWVYVSWLVTLLGAEFSCCLGIFRDELASSKGAGRNDLVYAYRLLGGLWDARRQGRTLSTRQLAHALAIGPEEHLEILLGRLSRLRLVVRTEGGKWALVRDLQAVTLYDLYDSEPFVLPESRHLAGLPSRDGEAGSRALFEMLRGDLRERMDQPLEALIRQDFDADALANSPDPAPQDPASSMVNSNRS